MSACVSSAAEANNWSPNIKTEPNLFQRMAFYCTGTILASFASLLFLQLRQWIVVPWSRYPVVQHFLEREQAAIDLPVWLAFYLYFLPVSVAFYFSFIWWRQLFVFYSGRQPWASLKAAAEPATMGLTLNYARFEIPVLPAIRNRHWIVAFLSAGLIAHLAVPSIVSSLYTARWHASSPGNIVGHRKFLWRQNEISEHDIQAVTDSGGFDRAFGDMLRGLETPKRMPKWSTYLDAFCPAEPDIEVDMDSSGVWMLETSALRGELQCTEVQSTVEVVPSHSDVFRVEAIELKPLHSSDSKGVSYRIDNPCRQRSEQPDGSEARPLEKGKESGSTVDAFCGRWWMVSDPAEQSLGLGHTGDTTWAIAWLSGPARRGPGDQDMYFTTIPQAHGVLCKPVINKRNGILTLTSEDLSFANAALTEFAEVSTGRLADLTTSRVSRGLMDAMNSPMESVVMNGALATTPIFIGDIMSYTYYRHVHLRSYIGRNLSSRSTGEDPGFPPFNMTVFSHGSSMIFSTYLSVMAQRSDLFKQWLAVPDSIQIEPRRFEYRLHVNKVSCILMWCFVLLWFCTWLALGRVPKAYRMSLSPEPLVNSLYILAQGRLVDMMEERFTHDDHLNISSMLRKVEQWDERFKYGAMTVNDRGVEVVRYGIDVEENVTDTDNVRPVSSIRNIEDANDEEDAHRLLLVDMEAHRDT